MFHPFRDLLTNPEDYFTEFVTTQRNQTTFFLTLHLPHANLTNKFKPQLGLEFQLMADDPLFFLSVHPPHHVRYDSEVLDGLQRKYLSVDDVKPGQTKLLTYSFSLTKVIKRTKCVNENLEVDTCQRASIEEKLGCKLPWMRGAQRKSKFDNVCLQNQLENVSIAMKELEDDACPVGCELYVPRISKEGQKYCQNVNSTNERRLSLMLYTDQQVIPVEQTVLSYDSLDAMADIGGYLGLLLGASCLSMVKDIFNRIY